MSDSASDCVALVAVGLQAAFTSRKFEPHSTETVLINTLAIMEALGPDAPLFATRMRTDGKQVPKQAVARPMPVLRDALPTGWDDLDEQIARSAPTALDHFGWDAFFRTNLDRMLRAKGAGRIVLAGLATPTMVESTARSAWELGWPLVLIEDATSAMTSLQHQHCIEHIFPRLGFVMRTEEFLATIVKDAH